MTRHWRMLRCGPIGPGPKDAGFLLGNAGHGRKEHGAKFLRSRSPCALVAVGGAALPGGLAVRFASALGAFVAATMRR